MNIKNNILKFYLRNCLFINGTAYAGKSTMCKMLAEKYNLKHFEENYGLDKFRSMINVKDQPHTSYFHTMKSWQDFVNRSPEEYLAWIEGNKYEVADFELLEIIENIGDKKAIIDTNIPLEILREITDYNQVAVLLSPQAMSVERFFDREDAEKQFLLKVINEAENPEKTMRNFKECIAKVNSQEIYNEFLNSGFFTLIRDNLEVDTREETFKKLAVHFGLDK